MVNTKIKELITEAPELEKEAPLPLRRVKTSSTNFPIDPLPPLFKDAILALHDIIQAPIPICAQSVLAPMNLAVQGHADIMLPIGQKRPISCYFLTIAESGERKTSCDNEILKVVEDYEEKLRKEYNFAMEKWSNEIEIWEKHRQNILKNKKLDKNAQKSALDTLGKKPEMPLTPLLICPEPTFEGLCRLMLTGYPSLGLFSTEGGQFIGGYGMKEENKIHTAAALSDMWDGKPIKRVRAKDGTIILAGRRLSMHLMAQPNVAATFLSDHALRDQGILSRMFPVAPSTAAGTRFQHEVKIESHQALERYKKAINGILAKPHPMKINSVNELNPRVIPLTEYTKKIYEEFSDHIEKNIGPGGKLEPIKGLANKLPEHALRLAATIALAENINVLQLEREHLKIGIELVQYYADEALRLVEEGIFDPNILLAEKVLDLLHHSWEEENVSLPDIYQRSLNAINTAAKARTIIKILEDHGWLKKNKEGVSVKGKPRRESWKIIKG